MTSLETPVASQLIDSPISSREVINKEQANINDAVHFNKKSNDKDWTVGLKKLDAFSFTPFIFTWNQI